jgi:homospermidine synthase
MNMLKQLLAITEAKEHKKLVTFSGNVLIIGYGSVGQAILPMILRHVELDPTKITVLELGEHKDLFKTRHPTIKYVAKEIVKSNLDEVLSKHVSSGDYIIDVSLNIDGIAIMTWCLDHEVQYINTSIERWKDEPDETIHTMAERTLYHTHQATRKALGHSEGKATCIATHGANPGLVTHFVKAALIDIAKAMKLDATVPASRQEWAQLAQRTGTKVIHISERDTQVIDVPKIKNEFVNTWSCEGFWAEGRAPAELGWGTHEDPEANVFHHIGGPRNAVYLDRPGVATLVKSWVPIGGSYNGFLVQHSEAVTISEYLSIGEGPQAVYRPTVHYAYNPCDAAIVSVHEFRGRELEMQDAKRIVKDEIVRGIDELGVLLMGHGCNAWWYGSQLGIEEARSLLPHENATSVQVVASLLGAIVWSIKHPKMGYVEPEDLPYDEVLAVAKPYLGPMKSIQSDWTPLEDRNVLYRKPLDKDHPWRFANFKVWS